MSEPKMHDLWNKCDVCGRIISYDDFDSGKACRRMITPDSAVSVEEWETLCRNHNSTEFRIGG